MSIISFVTLSEPVLDQPTPQPGEIWELRQSPLSPVVPTAVEQQRLYSHEAWQFIQGKSVPRYVMVVLEPQPPINSQESWQTLSVMVLSSEIQFLSELDLLIPEILTGVGQDLLAETWNVQPMLVNNLLRPIGTRLSRAQYDLLLTVGDTYHSPIPEAPLAEAIQAQGLGVGATLSKQQPELQSFHQREQQWSDVLRVPLAIYHTYLQKIYLTEMLLNQAIAAESELAEVNHSSSKKIANASSDHGFGLHKQVYLGQWFQQIFEPDWQNFSNFWQSHLNLAPAIRGSSHSEEHHAKSLEIADLIHILQTAQDDDTLWATVERLLNLDPEHPATGVRRVKMIDLDIQGDEQTVALVVNLIQKADQKVAVRLQIYPTDRTPVLPTNLKMILLDKNQQILREVIAQPEDLCLQLMLNGQSGEEFGVRIMLGETSKTERFIL